MTRAACPRLTPSQVDAAAAVLRLSQARGYPPSEREVGVALGIAKGAAGDRLRKAARGGLTTAGGVADRRARGAKACRCGAGAAFLPVAHKCGGVAGSHSVAIASRDGVCPLCRGVVLLPPEAA